jgi:hypothetical protein
MYPWPVGNFDRALDDALYIAMDYLRRTGQDGGFRTDRTVGDAIVEAWKSGHRHPIKLANTAIRAAERGLEHDVRSNETSGY